MSSMVGKRYQQPRSAEGTVFDDKLKKKDADVYTGRIGKKLDPDVYTGRNIAKEQMTKEFKKGLRGKLYYGQEKV